MSRKNEIIETKIYLSFPSFLSFCFFDIRTITTTTVGSGTYYYFSSHTHYTRYYIHITTNKAFPFIYLLYLLKQQYSSSQKSSTIMLMECVECHAFWENSVSGGVRLIIIIYYFIFSAHLFWWRNDKHLWLLILLLHYYYWWMRVNRWRGNTMDIIGLLLNQWTAVNIVLFECVCVCVPINKLVLVY